MELRPRFSKVLIKNDTETRNLIKSSVNRAKDRLTCEDNGSYLLIKFRKEQRKVWTLQMNINLAEDTEGTIVSTFIGPSGNIWLAFMFFYSFFVLVFFGSLFYGLSQLFLHHPAGLFLIISVLSFITILGMYLVSYLGQMKSRNEVSFLSSWIKNTLNS
jgi:hypothetical protein